MAYQVLARKYRPQLFSDVIGQDHVTRTLLNALAQQRIAHGYIFSGHRGIGKTTIARILAAALNCSTPVGTSERPTQEPCRHCVNCREISSASRQETSIFEESHSFDVEEIDAATNRGIDDARLLTAKIQTRPTNKSKYRIIILDEAHQITDAAWNALLKTLEEPPDWAIFMFATTQPEDIPQTIRSRCQHFSFHAVRLDDIIGQLRSIAIQENIAVDDATLTLLAEAGDGSMRDALSIMDQAIASAPLELAATGQDESGPARPRLELSQVRELMGSVSNLVYEQILQAVHANDSAQVLSIVGRLLDAGNGAPQLARQFVRYLRNVIVAKVTNLSPESPATGIAADLLQISPEERSRAARSAALFTEEDLSRFLAILLRTFDELGYRQEQRFHLELGLLKLVHVQRLLPVEELLSQLGAKPSAPAGAIPTSTARPSASASAPSPNLLPPAKQPERLSRQPAQINKPAEQSGKEPSPLWPKAETSIPTQASWATPATSPADLPDSRSPAPEIALGPPAKPVQDVGLRSASSATISGALALANEPIAASSPVLQSFTKDDLQPQDGPQLVTGQTVAGQAAPAEPFTAPSPADGPDLDHLQTAFVSALAAAKGQQSASEQIEDATLRRNGKTLEIHTTVSAAMLKVVINKDAEGILQTTLRRVHPGALTLKLIPAAATAAAQKPRRPAQGSVAELAQKHPMVLEAQRIFSAEISNIIDLREKE
ncbi:MAG: DNA polymerase III subunit gamma/tau [Acidobacteriaceae bacterium]